MQHPFTSKPFAPWAAAAALALVPALLPAAARADSTFTPVVSGLDNPYGLAFGPNGGLYIAEAGTGGTDPGFTQGNGAAVTTGDTGSIGLVLNGAYSQPVTGLASAAGATGSEATGLDGLAFDSSGNLYGVFGFGGTPTDLTTLEGTAGTPANISQLGSLVSINLMTDAVAVDNGTIVPYETAANYAANNPGYTADVESNPYGLAPLPGGGAFAVTDGGGNVVLNASTSGSAATLLTNMPEPTNTLPFGPPFVEAVPTAITTGPGGNLFVGDYTGGPFPPGAADVFSVNPTTGAYSVYDSGLTGITGLAFDNGDLYVIDQTTNGLASPSGPGPAQLIQFDPTTGVNTVLATLPVGTNTTDLVAGPDNALYLSTLGSGSNTGQVLRYSLAAVPEPSPGILLALGLLPLALASRRRASLRPR